MEVKFNGDETGIYNVNKIKLFFNVIRIMIEDVSNVNDTTDIIPLNAINKNSFDELYKMCDAFFDRSIVSTTKLPGTLTYTYEFLDCIVPFGKNVNVECVISQDIKILRLAHVIGYDMKNVYIQLISQGNIECLAYAIKNNFSNDMKATLFATMYNKFDILKMLYESGCKMHPNACKYAILNRNYECLVYAHTHGCRIGKDAFKELLRYSGECVYEICLYVMSYENELTPDEKEDTCFIEKIHEYFKNICIIHEMYKN